MHAENQESNDEKIRYIDDDAWGLDTPKLESKICKSAPIYCQDFEQESSFMLALKYNRYHLLDVIYSKYMSSCIMELPAIKKDPELNLKWTTFVGLDLYLPLYLVWITVKHKRQKKELVEPVGIARLPQHLIREIIKYT